MTVYVAARCAGFKNQSSVNNYRQAATGKHQLFDINITNRKKKNSVFRVKHNISIILILVLILACFNRTFPPGVKELFQYLSTCCQRHSPELCSLFFLIIPSPILMLLLLAGIHAITFTHLRTLKSACLSYKSLQMALLYNTPHAGAN